jgi:trehalose-phosphatase
MKSFPHPAWLKSLQGKMKKPLALFLDYDGTLVPIAPRPQEAHLWKDMRYQLQILCRQIPVTIVSGRSLMDLRCRVGLREINYVGNHGMEIVGTGFRYQMNDASRWCRFLKKVACRLQTKLEGIPGILIEDKGYTLSVHYRLANQAARRNAARVLSGQLGPMIHQRLIQIRRGKSVWELRPPVEWDKGKAVSWILRQPGFKGRWPLYIGDDETDQDAFRAIRDKGIGIAVGPSQKKGEAHFCLAHQVQVGKFLKVISDKLSRQQRHSRVQPSFTVLS